MHFSAISTYHIFYFVLNIRDKIPTISIQQCRRQKEMVFVLQGVNECSFDDQNYCFLFVYFSLHNQASPVIINECERKRDSKMKAMDVGKESGSMSLLLNEDLLFVLVM